MFVRNVKSYPYGASYYPLMYPESEWETDLRLMAENGMNLIRTGDCHGGWDRIEPRRGEPRLDLLERFYRLADRYGIRILLTTGVASPPIWLVDRFPDVAILSSRGERYPLGASYHWACIHHPGYLAEAARYTEILARFAVAQPNHFGWQISNEIGFPFLPTREQGRLDLFCYCEHCQHRFREWLREKYGTLDELNKAWTWGTTSFWYTDWSQVRAPEAMPSAWAGVTRWIDWRLFWQDAFARFAGWQHDLLKRIDPDHPTSVNTFNFKAYDRFGVFTGLDQWQLVQRVDHVGYDLYPGSGNKLETRPEHSSIFLDHGRSVSASAGKAFWVHELESGPIGGWVLGPDRNTSPADILRYAFECIGHDAKLMLFMGWKEWDYQSLHWGGLVNLDSTPTPRLDAARRIGQYLKDNASFLEEARVPAGEVALLESKPNAIYFRGIDQEEILFAAQRGAYCALWELGYRVDFTIPDHVVRAIRRGDSLPWKVICLPLMAAMSPELGQALGHYVLQGGVVVGFARGGMVNDWGWYNRTMPLPGLREAFGLRVVEAERAREITVTMCGQQFAGNIHMERLELDDDTEVLGVFGDGQPAVTLHRYGKGFGLYIATQADSGYVRGSRLLRAALAEAFGRIGIRPDVQVGYEGKCAREVDAHLLEAPGRSSVLIASYLDRGCDLEIRVRAHGRRIVRAEAGFLEKRSIPWSADEDELTFSIRLGEEPVEVLDIYWQSSKGG